MLDDEEFKHALSLRGSGSGRHLDKSDRARLSEYTRLTGTPETNINAFYHHLTALYGATMHPLRKPLRSPQGVCGSCMHPC